MHLPVCFPLSRGGRDGLVGEDVERHLGSLLLDVLDEDCDLHRTANLNTVMGFHPSNISERKEDTEKMSEDQRDKGDI